VLLQTMERQLGLIIDKNLQRLRIEMLRGIDNEKSFLLTFAMNFLQVARISFANVALNIITCL
jgi:hypothetical protein